MKKLFQVTHKKHTEYFSNKRDAKQYRDKQSDLCHVSPGPDHRRYKK